MEIVKIDANRIDDVAPLFNDYMMFYKKPSDPERYKAYLEERLLKSESTIFVVYSDEGAPVGFVQNYKTFSSVSLGAIVILNDLFILPSFRGHGAAALLVKTVLSWAQEQGAMRVDLGTEKTNTLAQSLYEKIGFKQDTGFYAYSYSCSID
ncbi:GNAT family N-acetyltransferase [Marinomonas sp. 2405UD68-3]|uniref:GNAT family N-acetyltransferase n=1 Tax=Marinomonas sp. 2405UD68-3 TaxID=3391835 RepID=UPI0039C91B9A